MSTGGNTTLYEGIPDIGDAFVLIVKTEWNSGIVDRLEEGAISILNTRGIKFKTIVVPGAVEIPFAIAAHARTLKAPDAYIALGTVIRGDTPHFDYVCRLVTDGILQLNLQLSSPVIMGVLTVNTLEQAQERTGGIHGQKGKEAAVAAIKMIDLNRRLSQMNS